MIPPSSRGRKREGLSWALPDLMLIFSANQIKSNDGKAAISQSPRRDNLLCPRNYQAEKAGTTPQLQTNACAQRRSLL